MQKRMTVKKGEAAPTHYLPVMRGVSLETHEYPEGLAIYPFVIPAEGSEPHRDHRSGGTLAWRYDLWGKFTTSSTTEDQRTHWLPIPKGYVVTSVYHPRDQGTSSYFLHKEDDEYLNKQAEHQ